MIRKIHIILISLVFSQLSFLAQAKVGENYKQNTTDKLTFDIFD